MSRKLSSTLTIFVVFLFAFTTLAVAGEKSKLTGTTVTTKWEQMEVGDAEGHIIMISEQKSVYFNETNGERFISVVHNIVDINMKTGVGTLTGYGVSSYPNGDKSFRTHEGKPVGKGHWKGTWKLTGGTGKYEGAKGGGTWDSKSLGEGISYNEVEAEIEYQQ